MYKFLFVDVCEKVCLFMFSERAGPDNDTFVRAYVLTLCHWEWFFLLRQGILLGAIIWSGLIFFLN